jgi:hypothetical protein
MKFLITLLILKFAITYPDIYFLEGSELMKWEQMTSFLDQIVKDLKFKIVKENHSKTNLYFSTDLGAEVPSTMDQGRKVFLSPVSPEEQIDIISFQFILGEDLLYGDYSYNGLKNELTRVLSLICTPDEFGTYQN